MSVTEEELFKSYINEVKKDRLSYYEMLYQKYAANQDKSDIVDLRTFEIIKKKGTSKQVQNFKPFGRLTKYKISKSSKKTIKILKRRIKIKRSSAVTYENEARFSLELPKLKGSFWNFSSFVSKKSTRCSSEITYKVQKDKILEFSNHTEHVLRTPTIDCLDFSNSPYHIQLKRKEELLSKMQSLKKKKNVTCETHVKTCQIVLHQLQLPDGYGSDIAHIPTKDILKKRQNVHKVNEIKRFDLLEKFENKLNVMNGQNSNSALNIDISKAVYFKSSSSIKTDRKRMKGRTTKNIIDYEEELLFCTSVSSKDISSNEISYNKPACQSTACESLPCSPVIPNLSPNFKSKSIKVHYKDDMKKRKARL